MLVSVSLLRPVWHLLDSCPYFLHLWQYGHSAEACPVALQRKHCVCSVQSHALWPSSLQREHKILYWSQGIWLLDFTLALTPGPTHILLGMGLLIPLCETVASSISIIPIPTSVKSSTLIVILGFMRYLLRYASITRVGTSSGRLFSNLLFWTSDLN